jgi:hypothetical protein
MPLASAHYCLSLCLQLGGNGASPPLDLATETTKPMDDEDDLVAESDGPISTFQTVGPQRLSTIIKNKTAEKWRRVGPCRLTVAGDCSQVVCAFCNPTDRDFCDQPIVSRLFCMAVPS